VDGEIRGEAEIGENRTETEAEQAGAQMRQVKKEPGQEGG